MNKNLKMAAWIGGALAAFGVAYVGFALALGGSVDKLLPGHEKAKDTAVAELPVAPAPQPKLEPAPAPLHVASGDLLDVFQIQSPYSSTELQQLASELKQKNKDLDQRLSEVAEREEHASKRDELLNQRQAELTKLRGELEQLANELEQRRVEVERDETAKAERDQQSWVKLAKLFNEGKAADQGKKLAGYSPEDAAKILDQLKPARAKELLDNIGADKWKEYAEAYRKLAEPKQK